MFTVACEIEESINTDLEKVVYKPKDHPGKVRFGGPIEIPNYIQRSIERATDGKTRMCFQNNNNNCNNSFRAEKKIAKYIEEGNKLDRYLFARHVNMERKEVFEERKKIQRQLQAEQKILNDSALQKGEISKTYISKADLN